MYIIFIQTLLSRLKYKNEFDYYIFSYLHDMHDCYNTSKLVYYYYHFNCESYQVIIPHQNVLMVT